MTDLERGVADDILHAWADNQLREARRAEVAVWLAVHPDARTRVEDWAAINDALHARYDPILEEPVPRRLLNAHAVRLKTWLRLVATALVWIAIGGALGWTIRDATLAGALAESSLSQRATAAFIVYAPEIRHPVEVGAAEEAHLVRWLSKRLGNEVHAPDLTAADFTLVGGRLLPDQRGRPAAQFMYQDERGERITLYVAAGPAGRRETAFRYGEEDGVRIFYWIDGPMGYALTGRIPKDLLSRLANETYRQLNL